MTREKAIITLENYLDYWKKISDEEAFPIDDDIEALSKAIEALQEQKTGKWMREVLGSTSGYGTTIMYQCANCEKMSISKYKFCPNCGARMVGEEE